MQTLNRGWAGQYLICQLVQAQGLVQTILWHLFHGHNDAVILHSVRKTRILSSLQYVLMSLLCGREECRGPSIGQKRFCMAMPQQLCLSPNRLSPSCQS
jgi:hypothetical protein